MTQPTDSWPAPVEVLNENGASDIVLLCEHASNHIPEEYEGLGLAEGDLRRHIAWDIGAADLTRSLSRALDAPAFLGGYSRLVVDLNRPLHAASSILARSEDTDIPGNRDPEPLDVARRVGRVYRPFHERVAAHIGLRVRQGRPTRVVSVHSFTPVFAGVARPWHAGVLYDPRHAERFGAETLEGLSEPSILVGANVPYRVSRDDDYGIYVHGADHGLPALIIEVRHDLLATPDAVAEWTERVRQAVSPAAAERRVSRAQPVPRDDPNGPHA